MKLISATRNPGKRHALDHWARLHGHEIVWRDFDITEIQAPTTAEIATQKAKDMFALYGTGEPAIASDAAFCMETLDGFPGVYAAHYMEEPDAFITLLYRAVGDLNVSCYFEESLVIFDGERAEVSTERIYGRLLDFEPVVGLTLESHLRHHLCSTHVPEWAWSDLWKVFIPDHRDAILAKMSLEEFSSWWAESGFHHCQLLAGK